MAKVKWGGLSADDIDSAESGGDYEPYDGDPPPKGIYMFRCRLQKGESKAGNDKLIVKMELVPRKSKPSDAQYEGFFMQDFIPVMASTAWRVRPFLEALGVTARDFVGKCLTDEDGNVTKIGNKSFVDGVMAMAMILPPGVGRNTSDEYHNVSSWHKVKDMADAARAKSKADDADDDSDDDDSGEDAPF